MRKHLTILHPLYTPSLGITVGAFPTIVEAYIWFWRHVREWSSLLAVRRWRGPAVDFTSQTRDRHWIAEKISKVMNSILLFIIEILASNPPKIDRTEYLSLKKFIREQEVWTTVCPAQLLLRPRRRRLTLQNACHTLLTNARRPPTYCDKSLRLGNHCSRVLW